MTRSIPVFILILLVACGPDTLPVQGYIARTDGVQRMIVERGGDLLDAVNDVDNTEMDLKNKLNYYSQFADETDKAEAWLSATPVPPPCAELHTAIVGALEALVEIRTSAERLSEMQLMGIRGTGVPSSERIDALSQRGREATDRMKQQLDLALKLRESLTKEFKVPVGRDGAAVRPKDKPYEYYDFQR